MLRIHSIGFFSSPVTGANDNPAGPGMMADILVALVNFEEHPNDSDARMALAVFNQLFSQARSIYVQRAMYFTGAVADQQFTDQIQRFKDELMQIDPATPGAQSLVWPYFVAAAESRTEVHRKFFLSQLEQIWQVTGYRNVLIAKNLLPEIWEKQAKVSWTAILSRITTIIM